MIRNAFRMSVHRGQEEEYERRHTPIWQELADTLFNQGVITYSVFIDPGTRDLFAYAEIESEEQWNAIASTPVCRRWRRYMREMMPSHADDSPVSQALLEVFHLGR